MRYLLDTQTLLWWITKPNVLSPSMRDFLDDRSNELFLSVVIPWELAIKTRTGKLDAHQILREIEFGQLMQDLQVLYADISHVIRAGLLPLHHRDPFDRLLIAQSLEEKLPLLSSDASLAPYGADIRW